ncbi:hypothetical protein [Aquamicrobium defluvii]|uniref:Uncharacterized protein n=1 Tax=Aquamicrobium defluvii TaxID=69279 RepID=A0A4R6Y0M8_9HYPH|nr:hypothetical protein [Aquamicrobium defluvii]TDR27791.1 hypothetical protein DES43_1654 [Aquamicrobium defluvii]
MMRCENYVPSMGAYWLEARVVPVRCGGEAKWEVSVNPPRNGNDGKVRLCDHCNRFDYQTFRRAPLAKVEAAA